MKSEKDTYIIQVDFDKNNNDPILIFNALSEIIDGFQRINIVVANSIDAEVEILSYLVDVESGSAKLKLKDFIKKIPDDVLANVFNPAGLLGQLCVETKKAILKVLGDTKGLPNEQRKEAIIENTKKLLKDSKISGFGEFNENELIKATAIVSKGSNKIPDNKLKFLSDNEYTEISKDFDIDGIELKSLPPTEMEVTIKIKKPDYVSDSQWQVQYRKNIDAKILDTDWLKKFQNNDVSAPPKSWLKVRMRETILLDENNEPYDARYEILKVLEVILPDKQEELFIKNSRK